MPITQQRTTEGNFERSVSVNKQLRQQYKKQLLKAIQAEDSIMAEFWMEKWELAR